MTIDELKKVNLIEYASSKYELTCTNTRKAHCPFHPPDVNPSFSIFQDDRGYWRWKDFHDGESGSIIDLKARMESVSTHEAMVTLLEEFGQVNDGKGCPKRIIRAHVYRNEHGKEFFKKVKYSNGEYGLFHWENGEWNLGKGALPPIPYNLDTFCISPIITVCEGEKDADTVMSLNLGHPVTTAPYGKASWPDEITPYFERFERIYFLYDVGNDDEVHKHAHKLHEKYPNIEIYLAHVPLEEKEADITDYLSTVENKGEAFAEIITAAKRIEFDKQYLQIASKHGMRPSLVDLSKITPQSIEWLWLSRIASGKLAFLVGDPGQGKSYLSLFMAALVSTGKEWPDGAPSIGKGSVLLLSAEDGVADTIVGRLTKLGADRTKIKVLDGVIKSNEKEYFDLSKDIEALEIALNEMGDVRLVVIDPISAYLGNINAYSNSEVRRCLAKLSALAEEYGVAILCISHLNKKQDLKTIYRSLDSMAFMATARSAWLVCADPEDPSRERKLFLPIKMNVGKMPNGLAFRNKEGVLVFEEDPIDIDVDNIAQSVGCDSKSAISAAKGVLNQILLEGVTKATEIKRLADLRGVRERTLQRAKKELGVKAYITYDGAAQCWNWKLPLILFISAHYMHLMAKLCWHSWLPLI